MDASLQNLDNLNIDDDLKKINNNEQQTSNQNEQINPEKNEIKKQITLEEAIKMYMQNNKLLIVIGTPCYSAMLHNGYFQSMTELCKFLHY